MTGPGGAGKSHIIQNILQYCQQFCALLQQPFTRNLIVVTALTGVAATSILGETVHSALGINIHGGINLDLKKGKGVDLINAWKETKLLIIDEISFASKRLLKDIVVALEVLKQNRDEKYGGISILLSGDFCQLEPIGSEPIFKGTQMEEWNDWLNAFVELKGGHRFKDRRYFELLNRLRDGTITKTDFDFTDSRVISKRNKISLNDMPPGTQIACSTNKDRCTMNHSAFRSHLRNTHEINGNTCAHTLIVCASSLKWFRSKKVLSKKARHDLYEKCGDFNVQRSSSKFLDPFLKLYIGIPLMLTDNDDVPNGIANGTLCTLKKVLLKRNGITHMTSISIDTYNVNCIESSYIEHLIVEIQSNGTIKREISIDPSDNVCIVNMPMEIYPGSEDRYDTKMMMHQFPVLINHATTVHKLQGKTVESLYITNWSYQANWVYVALSRVRSLDGLFLRKPLLRSKNFRPHGHLLRMLRHFRTKPPMQDCFTS